MINWYGKEILKNEEKHNTNIYLNTELSKDEVTSIIKKFMLSKNLSMYEVTICKSENYDEYAIYLKFYNDRAFIDFSTHISSEGGTTTYSIFDSGYSTGWTPEAPTTTLLLENVSIIQTTLKPVSENAYNNELTQLLSSVPFVKGEEYNFVEISSSSGSGTDMLQARANISGAGLFAFYPKSSLFDISGLDTSNVTSMASMFYSCSALTIIPQLETSKVTDMTSMFHYCSKVTAIPNLYTSKVTNMTSMFNNCRALTTIPQLDTSKVTKTNMMFYNCLALTTIPQLDTSKVTNMNSMFRDCSKITTIDITYYNISSTSNSSNFVLGCTALKSLIIRSFGENYILNSNSFTDSGIANKTGYIYVPRSMVDTLSQSTNWSTYASQIRALEDYTVDGTTTGALDESKI